MGILRYIKVNNMRLIRTYKNEILNVNLIQSYECFKHTDDYIIVAMGDSDTSYELLVSKNSNIIDNAYENFIGWLSSDSGNNVFDFRIYQRMKELC